MELLPRRSHTLLFMDILAIYLILFFLLFPYMF